VDRLDNREDPDGILDARSEGRIFDPVAEVKE
jgi:hypothetical protein